jgi:bifunctional UDP-N-acetylglucosamine pyrophosphorylase/glucosamine-1-phosphate N-acetyltransferase
MQAVILAAGKGSRLAPITNSRSKGMLPILGKPIVGHIFEGLIDSGLRDFFLVVSPEDREIREYFHGEFNLEINIQFVDQVRRLGTADALKRAAPYLDADFVLSACDILVPVEEVQRFISAWTQQPDAQGLLSLERIPLEDTLKTGIVTLEGDQVTDIIEKPLPEEAPSNISSTPLYIFSQRILDYLPQVPISIRGEYELQDAIQMMINDVHAVRGLFLQNRLTLTTAEDLLEINLQFLNRQPETIKNEASQVGPGTKLVPPVYIEAGVEIGSNCRIGPGVYLEKNTHIGDSVQLEEVVALRGSIINNEVVLKYHVIS